MHIQEPGTILEYLKTEIKNSNCRVLGGSFTPYATKPKKRSN